jgi:putative ABC transport system substrate-binding protein
MMDRRAFVAGTFAVIAAPLAAVAQQAGKVYRVGLVSVGASQAGARTPLWQAFVDAMRELNYVEGRNLVLKQAFAGGKVEILPGLIADLVQARVDVIVTSTGNEALVAKRATATTPIVMTVAIDPVGQGLVTSLARPGGNVTGLTSLVPGVSEKYVELLHEVVPSASRFAVVARPPSPSPEIRRDLQAAARQLGVTLAFAKVSGPDDFEAALARAKRDGVGGIIVGLDAVTYLHRATLVQLVLKHRLPGIYWSREFVEAGGLMTYGASVPNLGRRAAYFVDRILKGARPADLPVEQPTRFELVVNLKTARVLGLTIPRTVLARADEVIE